MSSSDDHIYGLAGFGFFCLTAILVAIVLGEGLEAAIVAKHTAPAPSALVAEYWTPCEAPRPDVACWRSVDAVVCLPLSYNEENE